MLPERAESLFYNLKISFCLFNMATEMCVKVALTSEVCSVALFDAILTGAVKECIMYKREIVWSSRYICYSD